MQVAVGSSIQISLFVTPFMVILGWILGKPLSLLFDPFESIVSCTGSTHSCSAVPALIETSNPGLIPLSINRQLHYV